jgi:hypothetical protein
MCFSLHEEVDASRIVVTAGGTRRVPDSTPMISAMEDSTRVRCPADGSSDPGGDPGHMERYSPPGPNLHAGSIRPILCVFILDPLCLSVVFDCCLTGLSPIGDAPTKTQTKTEQICAPPGLFCAAHPANLPLVLIWDP